MHWHQDSRASSSKFYPPTGRSGRKMVGGTHRTGILRQKAYGLFKRWVKAYGKYHNGLEPTMPDQREAIDNPTKMAKDIERWATTTVVRIKHQKESCGCKPCLSERSSTGRPWTDVLQDYIDAEEQRRIEKEKVEKIEEEAREARAEELAKRIRLQKECRIPHIMMVRLSRGLVGRDIIFQCFKLTEQQLDSYMWAYNLEEGK